MLSRGSGAAIVEVEVVCTEIEGHRRRVQARATDVVGLVKPTWQQVQGREYEPRTRDRVRVDSARMSVRQAVDRLLAVMADRCPRRP